MMAFSSYHGECHEDDIKCDKDEDMEQFFEGERGTDQLEDITGYRAREESGKVWRNTPLVRQWWIMKQAK